MHEDGICKMVNHMRDFSVLPDLYFFFFMCLLRHAYTLDVATPVDQTLHKRNCVSKPASSQSKRVRLKTWRRGASSVQLLEAGFIRRKGRRQARGVDWHL